MRRQNLVMLVSIPVTFCAGLESNLMKIIDRELLEAKRQSAGKPPIWAEPSTTNSISDFKQSYRRLYSLNSSELRGYLTGLIFGDACLQSGVTKRALEIKSIHKDFITQIYDDLKSCTNFDIVICEHPAELRGGVSHKKYWRLTVRAHPYFAKRYHHFYDDMKRRTASREAVSWLTPQGLANWYMSDGYVCLVGKTKGEIRGRRVDIATDRYDIQTIRRMIRALFNKFGIGASLIKRGNRFRIRITSQSYEDFFNLIRPYIVPSMRYKMYLGYEQQPEWMSDSFWAFQTELKSAIAHEDVGEDIVCG